ncbi:MAG: O-antigen ligase family protein [Microthrixaceae bacterium]
MSKVVLPRARLHLEPTTDRRSVFTDVLRPVMVLLLASLLVFSFDVVVAKPGFVLPNTFPLLLGLAAIGLAFTLPAQRPVMLPLSAWAVLLMEAMSVLWSHDEPATMLWVRTYFVVALGMCALAVVLPRRDVEAALRLFVYLGLGITLLAVATDPMARIHIDPTGMNAPLPGWHGWFIHKNVMTRFLVVAVCIELFLDRRRLTKFGAFGAIAFLFAVSASTTGLMAVMVVIGVAGWLAINGRLEGRSSVAFAISSVALGLVASIAVAASLSAIADAAGKDLTFTGRTKIWSAVWHAILRDPFVGVGVGGLFAVPRTPETMQVLRDIGFVAGHSHNGFIDLTSQLGFVGLLLALAMLLSAFRLARSLADTSPTYSRFLFCLLTGLLVMSVGESVLLGSTVPLFAVVLTVLLRERGPSGSARNVRVRHSRSGPSRTNPADRRGAVRSGGGATSTPTRRTPTVSAPGTGRR